MRPVAGAPCMQTVKHKQPARETANHTHVRTHRQRPAALRRLVLVVLPVVPHPLPNLSEEAHNQRDAVGHDRRGHEPATNDLPAATTTRTWAVSETTTIGQGAAETARHIHQREHRTCGSPPSFVGTRVACFFARGGPGPRERSATLPAVAVEGESKTRIHTYIHTRGWDRREQHGQSRCQ